jgi:hypothetical protein
MRRFVTSIIIVIGYFFAKLDPSCHPRRQDGKNAQSFSRNAEGVRGRPRPRTPPALRLNRLSFILPILRIQYMRSRN